MRPGDVLSRVFDKPLAIMSTSSYRAEAGTIQGRLDMAKYITMPKGELAGRVLLVDDLADSGVTLRAVVERLRGMPSISELRSAVIWTKGVSSYTPDYYRRDCCPPARGSTSRSRSTTICGPAGLAKKFVDLMARAARSCQHEECGATKSAAFCGLRHLVPRKGLEPPRSYPLVPETSASTNSATWAFQEVEDYIIKANPLKNRARHRRRT